MAIDWQRLTLLGNKQEIEKELRRLIRPDNYGKAPDKWSLTELINERTNAANESLRIIQGVDYLGKDDEGHGPIKGEDGFELRIKLQVLSRQACTETADGKGIDRWDSTETDKVSDNGEFCPLATEPPKKGDVVWVKGAMYRRDPVSGERLVKRIKQAMVARMEAKLGRQVKPAMALYHYSKYKVDADGCITVPYLHAVQALKTKGLRIAYPQFASGPRRGSGNIRQITNWQFKEVCPDEKQLNKPKRTRGSNKPKGKPSAGKQKTTEPKTGESTESTEPKEAKNDKSLN